MNEEMVRRKKGGKGEKEKVSRRKEERKKWRKKYIPQIFQDTGTLH